MMIRSKLLVPFYHDATDTEFFGIAVCIVNTVQPNCKVNCLTASHFFVREAGKTRQEIEGKLTTECALEHSCAREVWRLPEKESVQEFFGELFYFV